MANRPVVAVTGGGSGLGAAMATAFAERGYDVAILDIDGPRAQGMADGLRNSGTQAIAVGVDVADRTAMDGAATTIEATLGPVSVLCANVGVQQIGAIEQLSSEDWQWVLSVNVIGTVNTVVSFLPQLRRSSGTRRVVFTASAAVLDPGPVLGAYTASKYAVMGLGETLRLELASEDIGVCIGFPAGMATRHLESSAAARPERLDAVVVRQEDLTVLVGSGHAGTTSTVDPAQAVRNLVDDVLRGERYFITHGDYRAELVDRSTRLLEAFDRRATERSE